MLWTKEFKKNAYRKNTHNFSKYQYKIFISGVKIAYRFLRTPTMAHGYISQKNTWIEVRILTFFRNNKWTYKKI